MSNKKISRKDFIKFGGATLGAAALGGIAPGLAQRATRSVKSGSHPNILFIVVDQLRSLADVPKQLPLPAFDRMVREGRSFENYHVHQAPCGPSRSMIYTGQYVQKTGVYTNPPGETSLLPPDPTTYVELPVDFPTIGKMLREQGYYTAYKGKWHLSAINQKVAAAQQRFSSASASLEPYGFSDYNIDGEHSGLTWVGFGHDGFIAADAINLLSDLSNGRTGGKPWFFAVNFVNPHDIMFFDSTHDPLNTRAGSNKEAPPVPLYRKDWKIPLPKSFYQDDLSTKPAVQRPNAAGEFARTLDRKDEGPWRTYQNYYFNCICDVDRHIASVLDALDRLGLADNTIVFLTSDHGERGGAHGMRGKGADVYKETVRVPLIVRHPDVRGGKVTKALASGVDLTPTILNFAGVSVDARAQKYPYLHGVDLGPVIADAAARTARDDRGVLFDYTTLGRLTAAGPAANDNVRSLIRGVFDGRHKFARYFKASEHHIPRDWNTLVAYNDLELYDTERDPDELINLAYKPEAHRDLILALNAKINALIDNEIGADDGSIYPGPTSLYELKS